MSTALRASLLVFVFALGACDSSSITDDVGNVPDACTTMECAVVDCSAKGLPPTTISGRVFAPNGTLPLQGVTVYVPQHDPGPLPSGLQCDRCGAEPLGGMVTQAVTGVDGRFTLVDVPADREVMVVVQTGKWRRMVTVPGAAACQDTALSPELTRLPRDRSEGDLPNIAITTGAADALECLVRKIGIADSELTTAGGDGRVQLFDGNGARTFAPSFPSAGPFADARTLWNDPAKLREYDVVILSCEGAQRPQTKPQSAMQALHDYADLGGRVFMSHWHNIWLGGERGKPSHGLPDWQSVVEFDYGAAQHELTQTAIVEPSSGFASWLRALGATRNGDELLIHEPRYTAKRLKTPVKAQQWLTVDPARSTPRGKQSVQDLMFTTPLDVDHDERCGKVVFSDMHVSADSSSAPAVPFPSSCATSELTPQEMALAFMFFEVSACIQPIL